MTRAEAHYLSSLNILFASAALAWLGTNSRNFLRCSRALSFVLESAAYICPSMKWASAISGAFSVVLVIIGSRRRICLILIGSKSGLICGFHFPGNLQTQDADIEQIPAALLAQIIVSDNQVFRALCSLSMRVHPIIETAFFWYRLPKFR
jgi:hypothetical protein